MRILQTGLTHIDGSRASPGFTLFSPLWDAKTFIVDMQGNVVHEWDLPGLPGGYARLLPNGNLFVATGTDTGPEFKGGAQGGLMQELDWNGNVVNEYVDHFQHHDCYRLPNGHTLYTAWERMPEEHARRVRGGRAGSAPENGMYSDVVREADAEGGRHRVAGAGHALHGNVRTLVHPILPALNLYQRVHCCNRTPNSGG